MHLHVSQLLQPVWGLQHTQEPAMLHGMEGTRLVTVSEEAGVPACEPPAACQQSAVNLATV